MKTFDWMYRLNTERYIAEMVPRFAKKTDTSSTGPMSIVNQLGLFLLGGFIFAWVFQNKIVGQLDWGTTKCLIVSWILWTLLYTWLCNWFNSGSAKPEFDYHTYKQLGVFVGGGFLVTALIRFYLNDTLPKWGFSPWQDTTYRCMGWSIWLTFYATCLLKYFWAWINPGTRALYGGSLFNADPTHSSDTSEGGTLHIPNSVRELAPGLRGLKFGGERWMYGMFVRKQTICDRVLTLQDEDQEVWLLGYQLRLGGLSGYMYNLYLLGEKAGNEYFQGQIRSYVEQKFAKVKGEQVRSGLLRFSKRFSRLFSGDGVADIREKLFGRDSRALSIVFCVRPDEVLNAVKNETISAHNVIALERYRGQGVPPLAAFTAIMGVATELVNVTGSDEGGVKGGGKGRNKKRKPKVAVGVGN